MSKKKLELNFPKSIPRTVTIFAPLPYKLLIYNESVPVHHWGNAEFSIDWHTVVSDLPVMDCLNSQI